ncbi:CAMK protein kinase [Emergomyces pasteurianus Ep9510]|uniref:CAMK protein kinase n=1 Tax=Emergomyces pasteurianus Ep9510 TaxID=1447872 RepID=A0A1J9PXQ5_9EURO|nr:CAMK protein kinase [Emergomyces pasteurianus Ep9510]
MHRPAAQMPVLEPPSPQNELGAGTKLSVHPAPGNPPLPPLHASQQQACLAPGPADLSSTCTNGGNNYAHSKRRPINTSLPSQQPEPTPIPRTPSLQICTHLPSIQPTMPTPDGPREPDLPLRASISSTSLPRRAPSIRTALAAAHSCAGSISPSSVFSSPQLAALTDITPLPSPILLAVSPWKSATNQSPTRTPSTSSRSRSTFSIRRIGSSEAPRSSSSRRHVSGGLVPPSCESQPPGPEGSPDGIRLNRHSRNRSLSDYRPDTLHVPPPRKTPPSNTLPHLAGTTPAQDRVIGNNMHREEYLAIQRGIALPSSPRPPTPPRSTRSGYDSSDMDLVPTLMAPMSEIPTYHVKSVKTQQPRKYRMLRKLGQGTFSQVVLAVRDDPGDKTSPMPGYSTPISPRLVAVKIVEYGPARGADQERVATSLNREVEILKSLNYPSLVQLKAYGGDEKRALLVLDYCPGGDLFEFASGAVNPLSQPIIRRIFAELVAAVRYLHANFIVHRDIKLENVLVNIPASVIRDVADWRTYPRPLVTLSDLGLSRRIPQPPASTLLQTRCGSEDYAAPEILMGQPYDGRSTDAWAMGVLLYAIMESRLPFDPLPDARGDPAKLRARTPHRIARCEWSWYRFANEDGDWDPVKGQGREGARACVEGLLRRSTKRLSLDEIASMSWIQEAIDVPEGLKRGDIEVP